MINFASGFLIGLLVGWLVKKVFEYYQHRKYWKKIVSSLRTGV